MGRVFDLTHPHSKDMMHSMTSWNDLKKQPNKEVYEPVKTVAPTLNYVGDLPPGSIPFDIESYGVEEMWRRGTEYIRLVGWCTTPDEEVSISNTAHGLVDQIRRTDGLVIGHNVYGFDLILLDRLHGLSILELTKAGRVRDTKLLGFLADPPYSRTKQFEIEKRYGLQQMGIDYLGEGKMTDVITGSSVLKTLAKEFGGFGEIPQDHPQYVEYLKRDVECTRDLCPLLPISDYALREHMIAAVCATISIQGFRVDEVLLEQRIVAGQQKREQILTSLMEYGLPAPDSSASPHRTNAGIAAIDLAFSNLGVALPRTATGRPALGKDVLTEVAEQTSKPEVVDLTEAILGLNGIRCVPLNTEILTKEGWKTCHEVEIGDETLGLSEEGVLEWTSISEISIYNGNYPLIEMFNNHFRVTCTPNHRWMSDHRYNSSGWTKENPGTSRRVREMREASTLGSYDRIILSAMADTDQRLNISPQEAELVGWIFGDGYMRWNPNGQVKSKYLVCGITQSKPEGVETLRKLLSSLDLDWSERFSAASNNSYVFTVKSTSAKNLWRRCRFEPYTTKNDVDPTQFVLSLGPVEREAFIRGFWGAEGHYDGQGNRIVSQNAGKIADAIRLAVFLDGHRATLPNRGGFEKIRCDAPPTITGENLRKVPCSPGSVWCPTTGLGTWVMRQTGQICLTGNTIYANIQDNMVNDKVHPSINLRQSTGRLSIQNPGLTVIGKRGGKVIERQVFLPDDEDSVLLSADLSQVDARAVAALSQDLEYMKLFEPGRDMHAEMALRLFGTEARREDAKAAVHGINYGMRSKKLALTTGMTPFEAQDVIINFENSFPRLVNWQQEMRETGELDGVLYNGFGRMMRIEPERAFTQSPALMGQSTARDLLMEGILRLWEAGGEQVVRMIRGVIHDELVLSCKAIDSEEIGNMMVEAMSFEWCPDGAEHAIKIEAGVSKPGKTWAGCYDK